MRHATHLEVSNALFSWFACIAGHAPLPLRNTHSTTYYTEASAMADMHEELQRRIREDREQNPGCTYSTLRTSASSFLNGAVRAETLSRIIRCVRAFGGRVACVVGGNGDDAG